jgi:hypothetical protein
MRRRVFEPVEDLLDALEAPDRDRAGDPVVLAACPRAVAATILASSSHNWPKGVTNRRSKWAPLKISSGTRAA